MRNLLIVLVVALICSVVAPSLAAETPESTDKRITALENSNQVLREDLGNTRLELDTTKDALQKTIDEQAKALKDVSDRLNAEIAARGASDKLIAEMQSQLATQQAQIDKQKNDLNTLQTALAKETNDRLAADTQANKELAHSAVVAKKDRTVTYVLGLLLGAGLALKK